MSYTPGPWVCRPTIGPGDELLEAVISKSAGNVTVANDCLLEDADLIAAAPDLMEACEEAMAHFERELSDDPTMIESDFANAYELCKSAIKKAKGDE